MTHAISELIAKFFSRKVAMFEAAPRQDEGVVRGIIAVLVVMKITPPLRLGVCASS
jgi:hypothetical protein